MLAILLANNSCPGICIVGNDLAGPPTVNILVEIKIVNRCVSGTETKLHGNRALIMEQMYILLVVDPLCCQLWCCGHLFYLPVAVVRPEVVVVRRPPVVPP